MKVTLTALKADAGGIGGNTRPSDNLLLKVKNHIVSSSKRSPN
jgi:fructose 1,6-bisphosphate aldolase/phosphatase